MTTFSSSLGLAGYSLLGLEHPLDQSSDRPSQDT
jgi:hypothetical protein